MREWIANGAELAWLIDPERLAVEVYRPGSEPDVLVEPERVAGEGPVAGFVLDLRQVWEPLA
jgi:Uma2 family endonuclease